MTRWVRALACFAAIVLLLATGLSHLEQIAQLPAWLHNGTIRYLTSSRALAGIPIEFVMATWFLAIAGGRRIIRDFQSFDLVSFWSAVVLCAMSVGLLYRVGFECVPISLACLTSLIIGADVVVRQLRGGPRFTAWTRAAIRHDLGELRRSASAVRVLVAGAIVALAAQYLSLTAASTTSADRDAQLVRWFESEPQVVSADLLAPGKIRVVAFSDFLCPACSFVIPPLERTVERYRKGGYEEVEWLLKDFPLNADCNPTVSTKIHPLACRAAVAARVAEESLTPIEAQAFRETLYGHHGRLPENDFLRDLQAVHLLEKSGDMYEREIVRIRNDARIGKSIGVMATPTVFVEGRLLRDPDPKVLSAILADLLRKGRDAARLETSTHEGKE